MRPTFIILCSVIGLASGVGVLPDSLIAAEGDTVTFYTSLAPTETPFESIRWTFKWANIIDQSPSSNATDEQYRERITLSPSTGSLELRDMYLSEAGVYRVTIEPAGGAAAETGTTILNVYGLTLGVSVLPASMNASVGDTVRFTPSLAPTETPLISSIWCFDGVPIVTPDYTDPKYEGRITLFTSSGSLELRDLALSDAGLYSVNIVPAGGAPTGGHTALKIIV